MSDWTHNDGGSPVRNLLVGVAVIYMIGSVIFMVQAQMRLNDMEQQNKAAQNKLAKRLDDSNGQMIAEIQVVADRVGITQKDLNTKAGILQSEANVTQKRLKTDEDYTQQQFGAVNNDVAGVKGEVTDTRTDLTATKGRLETAIATTHDQLEELRHRGERDYLEFTLHKGQKPTHLSTVSLDLKKVDRKKGEFTLYVLADDRTIRMKDRNVNEPLHFYTGRDRNLFEVVVNAVDKDAVSGYLSTPKNAPTNARPDPRGDSQ